MKYLVGLSLFVAVLVLYGCGYCLMLKGRYVQLQDNNTAGPEQPYYQSFGPLDPRPHSAGHEIVTAFFAPANAIDRRMRRSEWKGPQPLTESPVSNDVQSNPQ